MKEGCEAFIMGWERAIEKALIGRENDKDVENKVCLEVSHACKGVDVRNAPKHDDHIMVDGQPVKVGPDGKVNVPGFKTTDDLKPDL